MAQYLVEKMGMKLALWLVNQMDCMMETWKEYLSGISMDYLMVKLMESMLFPWTVCRRIMERGGRKACH